MLFHVQLTNSKMEGVEVALDQICSSFVGGPLKSGSSLVHTSDISIRTRSIRKQSMISPLGLVKIKQPEFFFVSSFVRFLAYAWTMILCL